MLRTGVAFKLQKGHEVTAICEGSNTAPSISNWWSRPTLGTQLSSLEKNYLIRVARVPNANQKPNSDVASSVSLAQLSSIQGGVPEFQSLLSLLLHHQCCDLLMKLQQFVYHYDTGLTPPPHTHTFS